MRIVLAQKNMVVGDIPGNKQIMISTAQHARDTLHASAIVFPELSLTGYPPDDLLLRDDFMHAVQHALDDIQLSVHGIYLIVGYPELDQGKLYNSAVVFYNGHRVANYRKQKLPNYGVFDEKRYFTAGDEVCVFNMDNVPTALCICEDAWFPGVVEKSAQRGAQCVLNLNASPYHLAKIQRRETAIRERISTAEIPMLNVNLIGGQDELIFDGASFVMDAFGTVIARAAEFEDALLICDMQLNGNAVSLSAIECKPEDQGISSIYKGLVLGIRDYVQKNRFKGVVLGLSGGIDSALTLALATDALGADNVEAVMMPYHYTSDMSKTDAAQQAELLGVHYHSVSIESAVSAFQQLLSDRFSGMPKDTTEENLQARSRGVILMAISNKTGKLLLTTGNKSEMSVGYATLYGDMAGGFAPLKDVSKLLVFKLAEYRNTISPAIPQRVIERPPSAELAPDQKDSDSLPPYDVLDPILERYVEQDQSAELIIAAGFHDSDVHRVIRLVDLNEYKRRQAPPGIRITPRAFGRDRRYPITNGFKSNQC
ncbi:MAG: NAD+ synthase [Gammaproteobacteria bacterium]|nr:NAD+ synthase [Gammaproteobacteria bacterium]